MNYKPLLITLGQGLIIIALLMGLEFLITWFYSVNPKFLKVLGGVVLVIFGIIVLIYGDRKLNMNEGKIGKIFFFIPGKLTFYSKMWKWTLGLVCIYVGISLLF
jgi:hypothetical protein